MLPDSTYPAVNSSTMSSIYSTPALCPKLAALAQGCYNGACNGTAIVNSLAEALAQVPETGSLINKHPAFVIVVGQLSFIAGSSLGPTSEDMATYEAWLRNNPISIKSL